MLQRVVDITLFLILVGWVIIERMNPNGVILFSVLLFLWVSFRLMQKNKSLLIWCLALLGAIAVLMWMIGGSSFYLFIFLITSAILTGLSWHVAKWEQRIKESKNRFQLVTEEVDVLGQRYETRIESLRHLEQKVGGLQKLFEVARELNECLSYANLVAVLDHKVRQELKFERGMIALVVKNDSGEQEIDKTLSFGKARQAADEKIIQSFGKLCLRSMNDLKLVTRVDLDQSKNAREFGVFQAIPPLWLFPLLAENQLIALFVVEGAREVDIASFELLASQLSLQVQKVRLYETVRELSIIDGLTKTFVRRHFLERFSEELKRAIRHRFPLSVLMVDVDNFKSYNDEFGHLVGDRTLREVAQIIRDNVRPVDVIGRYGGEEFVIVAPEIERESGLELAERIRSSVARKRFKIYDEDTRVTVSVGVSSFPIHLGEPGPVEFRPADLEILLQYADQALYRAKDEGRNRVVEYS